MCTLFIRRLWDYKSALEGRRNTTVLVIIALAVVVAGFCLWVVQFIATPTVRTLLRVFIGLCLAAVIAFLVLAAGFPTSLLVCAPYQHYAAPVQGPRAQIKSELYTPNSYNYLLSVGVSTDTDCRLGRQAARGKETELFSVYNATPRPQGFQEIAANTPLHLVLQGSASAGRVCTLEFITEFAANGRYLLKGGMLENGGLCRIEVVNADTGASLAQFETQTQVPPASTDRRFLHESGTYGELETGDTTLSFAAHELGEMNFKGGHVEAHTSRQPLGMEVGFVTEDVLVAHAKALANGATQLSAPSAKPWGQVVSYVRFQRTLLVPLRQFGPIIGMLPGLRFLFLVPLWVLRLRLIPPLLLVSHCHLPSVRIGHSSSIDQGLTFGRSD
ncbi:hypothetical protein BHE74_00000274 [Ensete ventricosum]|nr:hypothetical protein BHE74_00000274 [Ensete ventricosum]